MSDILTTDAKSTTDASTSTDSQKTDQGAADKQPAQGDQSQTSDKKADPAPWLDKAEEGKEKKAESDKDKAKDSKTEGEDKEKKPEGDEGKADKDQTEKDDKAAPEEYAEFKLADGVQVNEEVLKDFTALAKEANLTQEQAQKFIDFQNKIETARAEALTQEVTAWTKQAETDKEYGGAAFQENVASANIALAKYGSPELIGLLKDSGFSNHPEVIRCFVKIGKELKEGGSKRTTSQSSGKKKLVDIYD